MSETDEETWVSVTLTCQTDGCGNQGVAIELMVPDTTSAAMCGACGQPITDVSGDVTGTKL